MLKFLMDNPVAWMILAIFTIASLIYAIYADVSNKKRQEFTSAKSNYQIIKKGASTVKKLNLLFDNKNIDDLTITKLAIWNCGNKEVRSNDMVSDKPLSIISTGEANILDAEILVQSDEDSKFKILISEPKRISLDFEFVNQQEGIVVQIFHTGSSSDLRIDGRIMGSRNSIKNYDSSLKKEKNSKRKQRFTGNISKLLNKHSSIFAHFFLILSLGFMTVFSFLRFINIIPQPQETGIITISGIDLDDDLFLVILLGLMTLFHVFLAYFLIREEYHFTIPAKLRPYIEIENISGTYS